MASNLTTLIGQGVRKVTRDFADALKVMTTRGPSQIQFWFIALAVGIAAGCAYILWS